MKGSEIDDPGHLIGLKPRRFPIWGDRQQPIKICPLCSVDQGCPDAARDPLKVLGEVTHLLFMNILSPK